LPEESKSKEEIQEKSTSETEENIKEQKTAVKSETEKQMVESKENAVEEESKDVGEETVKTEKPKDSKKDKPKKEAESKKKDKKDDDFQYIVRISNTDIDGDKNIVYGLTSIKGIGMHMATLIMEKTDMNRNLKMGKLTESQIKKLQDAIDNINQDAPNWMLNHRKDVETGEDVHLIGPEIETKLRDEINMMKKIRSYRGIRHERGLPVRGQRTRANNRRGLSLGVSKKRN
jgi:small subunit ribosomal protein S13